MRTRPKYGTADCWNQCLENSKDVLRGTTCEKNLVRHQFALARPALTPALRSRIRPSHATRACECALPARAHAPLACSPSAHARAHALTPALRSRIRPWLATRARMRAPRAGACTPGMLPASAHARAHARSHAHLL